MVGQAWKVLLTFSSLQNSLIGYLSLALNGSLQPTSPQYLR